MLLVQNILDTLTSSKTDLFKLLDSHGLEMRYPNITIKSKCSINTVEHH